MQSSTNFARCAFNLATQGARQAGSTFKAIALTAAVDDGIDPNRTYYLSTPSWDCNPPLCPTPWHVETYDHARSRNGLADDRDAQLRQRRVRQALDRPQREARGADGAPARHPLAAEAGSVDRARVARGDPARADERVRDARGRWRLPAAAGGAPGARQRRRARRRLHRAGAPAGRPRRGRLGRHRDPRAEHGVRHGHARAPRRRAARRPGRPGRRATTPTPGSAATPPTSRPASGSATRRAGSRCRTSRARAWCPGRRSPRRSGTTT